MSVSAETLRKLAALNLSSNQMASVLDILAGSIEADETRKEAQRERTRRAREKSRLATVALQSRDGNRDDTHGGVARVEDKLLPTENTQKEESKNSAPAKPSPRKFLETVLDAERAESVIEHRKRIKSPLTGRAAELLAKDFAKWPDPNAAADEMVKRGWRGFEPSWMPGQRAGPQAAVPSQADVFAMIGKRQRDEQFPGSDGSPRAAIPDLSIVRTG